MSLVKVSDNRGGGINSVYTEKSCCWWGGEEMVSTL